MSAFSPGALLRLTVPFRVVRLKRQGHWEGQNWPLLPFLGDGCIFFRIPGLSPAKGLILSLTSVPHGQMCCDATLLARNRSEGTIFPLLLMVPIGPNFGPIFPCAAHKGFSLWSE